MSVSNQRHNAVAYKTPLTTMHSEYLLPREKAMILEYINSSGVCSDMKRYIPMLFIVFLLNSTAYADSEEKDSSATISSNLFMDETESYIGVTPYQLVSSNDLVCEILLKELNSYLDKGIEVNYEASNYFLNWRHINKEDQVLLWSIEVDLNQDGHTETLVKKEFGGRKKNMAFYGYNAKPERILSLFDEYAIFPSNTTWSDFHTLYVDRSLEDYHDNGVRPFNDAAMEYSYEILSSIDPKFIGPHTLPNTRDYHIFRYEGKPYLAVDRFYRNAWGNGIVDVQYSLMELNPDGSLTQTCLLTYQEEGE